MSAAFVAALPVQHAAISTLGDPFDIETVCASDAVAASLAEVQLDLGVGPSWQARSSRAPVLLPDLRRDDAAQWPAFASASSAEGIRSVYAFPMAVGLIDVGVVDLYSTGVRALGEAHVAEAALMASAAATEILAKALDQVDTEYQEGPSPRRLIHQATGMVVAQLRVTPASALLIIRAHSFATSRSVREVAISLIARDIDFSV